MSDIIEFMETTRRATGVFHVRLGLLGTVCALASFAVFGAQAQDAEDTIIPAIDDNTGELEATVVSASPVRKPAVNETVRGPDRDTSGQEAEVGKLGARSQVGITAQDGVAKIGKMTGLGIV